MQPHSGSSDVPVCVKCSRTRQKHHTIIYSVKCNTSNKNKNIKMNQIVSKRNQTNTQFLNSILYRQLSILYMNVVLTIPYIHKHVHWYIKKISKIAENLFRTSKHSLIYWQVCFVDTRLCGLRTCTQIKILVSSNFEYFFLTCLYRRKTNKWCKNKQAQTILKYIY